MHNKYNTYLKNVCEKYSFHSLNLSESFFSTNDTLRSLLGYFENTFQSIDSKTYEKLSFSLNLLYSSIVVIDNILDEKIFNKKETLLLAIISRDEALQILSEYFSKDSSFWKYFHKYQQEYIKSLFLEDKKHFGKYSPYSLKEIEQIGAGKSAMLKIYPTALALLEKEDFLIEQFEKSFDAFSIAAQLYDDLRDWRIDFKSKKYSYILSTLIKRKKLHNRLNDITEDEVGRMIFFTSLTEDIINLIVQYYEKAISELENINCNDWKVVIKLGVSEILDFKENHNRIREKELERVRKEIEKKQCDK